MKTAAELASQINNETWDTNGMRNRGVTVAQLQEVMAGVYQQALTDAVCKIRSNKYYDGHTRETFMLTVNEIDNLRNSKRPEMF